MQLSIQKIRRAISQDHGIAMAAVVGVIALTAVVGLTVTAVTVNALGFTAGTRADLQARSAAEAGIDVTEAGLRSTTGCTGTGAYASTVAPIYATQVSYKSQGQEAGAWQTGCPPQTSTLVRVVSTGTAPNGDTAKLEAQYSFTPATSTTVTTPGTASIAGTGGAIHASATNTLNNLGITIVTSGSASSNTGVRIRTGSFTCQGGRTIEGDLVVENGSIELNGCIVLGSIRASGYVAINSGTNKVTGDIYAGAGQLYSNQYGVQVGPDSTITGNIFTNAPVYINGKVTGSITAAGSALGISTITPSAKITGSLSLAGLLTTWVTPCNGNWTIVGYVCALTSNGIVGGLIKYLQLGLTPAPSPSASGWVPYTYKVADWTAAGFTEMTWSGSCTVDNNAANRVFLNSVLAMTTPVVVNATGCSTLLFSKSAALQLNLKANVAFIAPKISIEEVKVDAVSANTKVWFITPGTLPLTVCADIKIKIDNKTTIGVNVAAIAYSPGCIAVDATTWRGQFYAGYFQQGSSLALTYIQVGLPGVSLDDGTATTTTTGSTSTTTTTAGFIGSRTSLRDLDG